MLTGTYQLSTKSSLPRAAERSRRSAYLHPGRLLVAAMPTAVTTILGSCIAVCVFDLSLRLGGLVHFVLPRATDPSTATLRHGDLAVDRLVDELLVRGAEAGNLQAKIFGGAHVLATRGGQAPHLGEKNARVAEDKLARHRIPIVARETGGHSAYKLVFWTDDGSAWVKGLR